MCPDAVLLFVFCDLQPMLALNNSAAFGCIIIVTYYIDNFILLKFFYQFMMFYQDVLPSQNRARSRT